MLQPGTFPGAVRWMVILLGLLTVGFTGSLGMRSPWVHLALVAGLTTAMVVVVSLIVQLDYPFCGTISVSADPYQQVLTDVRDSEDGGNTAPPRAAWA